ncbi:MAG: aldehyde ferredoxin oxidoreductase family protein [Actinobacteria bacterium]|nr:aldehyde ferredoxin oxidoreductase family protein [Actinomycetota bacterium]
MYGWMGTILRVDLSSGKIEREPLDENLAREYVGGRGLGMKILYDELNPGCDPLSPENILIFANGPLTLTGALSSGRYMVITKSPLTGTICSSNSGGYFPAAFKTAGYDAIVLKGKSEKPVYLWIDDDHVELRAAGAIWGKDTREADRAIKRETHKDARVACIGPAGENLVRFAAIINDASRAAARSGVGAVMGSKNLKGIAIRGTKGVRVHDPEELLRATVVADHIKKTELGEAFGEFGTPLFVDIMNANNIMPTENFREGFFEDGDEINGAEIIDRTLLRAKSCYACCINCGRNTKIPEGSKYSGRGDGPEYETCFSLGSNILVGDLDALTKMNYICNELGMDTMDAGCTVSAIMELFEEGLLNEEDIGFPMKWGDADNTIRLLEMIGHAEGFGKEAGKGGYYLAGKCGRPELFMGSKGQGFAGYHPRGMIGQALIYATSPEGGNHTTGNTIQPEINGIPEPMDPLTGKGKPALAIMRQDESAIVEACGLCVFPYMLIETGIEILAEYYTAVTGKYYTEWDIRKMGERIFNLERALNHKIGFTGKDDTLPRRMTEEPHTEGIGEGNVVHLDELLKEYYELRGWTPDGVPSEEKLAELGIS